MIHIPTDWPTQALWVVTGALVVLCTAFGGRPERFMALALVISWFNAVVATVTEHSVLYVAGLCLAAFVAYKGRSEAAMALGAIYAARVAWAGLMSFDVFGWYWMWIINNEGFLLIQLLLVTATLIDGDFVNGRISRIVSNISLFKTKISR